MNEETTQVFEKFADKIIQKVTQDFTEKLEVVRFDITNKITQDFTEKLDTVRLELLTKIEESNKNLNQKMDTGFEMMHVQVDAVEENLTSRIQGMENRMDNEAENRVTHYATKMEHKKLDERVKIIEGTLKLA